MPAGRLQRPPDGFGEGQVRGASGALNRAIFRVLKNHLQPLTQSVSLSDSYQLAKRDS
jgi:hypothetical protein